LLLVVLLLLLFCIYIVTGIGKNRVNEVSVVVMVRVSFQPALSGLLDRILWKFDITSLMPLHFNHVQQCIGIISCQ